MKQIFNTLKGRFSELILDTFIIPIIITMVIFLLIGFVANLCLFLSPYIKTIDLGLTDGTACMALIMGFPLTVIVISVISGFFYFIFQKKLIFMAPIIYSVIIFLLLFLFIIIKPNVF